VKGVEENKMSKKKPVDDGEGEMQRRNGNGHGKKKGTP